jgi:hypothetical protein
MRKKKIGLLVVLVFVIVSFLYLGLRKKEVTVYLGIANSSNDSIEVYLSLDSLILFDDYLHNNPFQYQIFKVSLTSGAHSLFVSSTEKKVSIKTKLFILFDQHIVIEYYKDCVQIENEPCFIIRNRLTPFYLE